MLSQKMGKVFGSFEHDPMSRRRVNSIQREVAMNLNSNPLHKRGQRNIFCPYYEACLDHAVERRWKYWNCTECPHKLMKQPLIDMPAIRDANPCYRLPARIYQQVLYSFMDSQESHHEA
jgi:hypothetical protein